TRRAGHGAMVHHHRSACPAPPRAATRALPRSAGGALPQLPLRADACSFGQHRRGAGGERRAERLTGDAPAPLRRGFLRGGEVTQHGTARPSPPVPVERERETDLGERESGTDLREVDAASASTALVLEAIRDRKSVV